MSLSFLKTLELSVTNVLDKLDKHKFPHVNWRDLAVGLRQGIDVIKTIGDETGGTLVKLNALITHWLRNDRAASWLKLVIAMERSEQKVAAENLAQDIGIPYPVK